MTAPAAQKYPTLRTVHVRLAELGVTCTSSEVRAVAALCDREQLVRALDAAGSNPKAKAFIDKALNDARANQAPATGGDENSSPQPPTPPDAMPPPPIARSRVPTSSPRNSSVPSSIGRLSSVADHVPARLVPNQSGDAAGSAPEAPQQHIVDTASPRKYVQHTVYGRQTAVQFSRSSTKARDNVTVNIKMGKAKGDTCKEGVNWDDAIGLMLTSHEIEMIAAVLIGYAPTVRFAGHGERNDKWFQVEENREAAYVGTLKVTVAQGKDRDRDIRSVNVSSADLIPTLGVLLGVLTEQTHLKDALLLASLRRSADLHGKQKEARSEGNNGQRQRAAGS